jgi:hypothetical protein
MSAHAVIAAICMNVSGMAWHGMAWRGMIIAIVPLRTHVDDPRAWRAVVGD